LNKVKRILSIDGGGLKGALPAAFLAEIEEATGKRIVDHFDLIAGTSTGGIIAIGLGLGIPARTILDFYIKKGPAVFRQDRPQLWAVEKLYRAARRIRRAKYAPDRLKSALSSILGEARIGDSRTRLLIPAYDSNRRAVHVIKTAHHPRFERDWQLSAVDAALATAAAPTYLPQHALENYIGLIDGGVWANNPCGLAAIEAVAVLKWNMAGSWTREAKAASISLSLPAFRIGRCTPLARAASCTSRITRSLWGLFGLTSRAITLVWGTSSDSSSSRLGCSSTNMPLKPVRLPPGCARLATKPSATGSPAEKTIGIVEVAFFAARLRNTGSATPR
jgi:hypothetical protein